MAHNPNKPTPPKASLEQLWKPKDVTPRGETITDMRKTGMWEFADMDTVSAPGNPHKYEE
jgi:hypothetical protein